MDTSTSEVPGRPRPSQAEPLAHFCHILVRRCLLSSSRAVFLALAQVNHSTLTIFALPLYKHRGTRPTDPITSLSGNKCLTIQPYWVWEINPFHSQALPVSSESSKADVTVIITVRHQICLGDFIGYFQGLFFCCHFYFLHLLSPVHFVVSYFIFLLALLLCVSRCHK